MSEEPEFGEYPPEAVLTTGLPDRIMHLLPGQLLPLASWQDERCGVVLYVSRSYPGQKTDEESEYQEIIEVLCRDEDGWDSVGSARSGWTDPFSIDPSRLQEEGVISTGIAGDRLEDGDWVFTVGGVCTMDARFVEVLQAGVRRKYPIETLTHAFVVGIRGQLPATVHLLGANEKPIVTSAGTPLRWELTSEGHLFPHDF